MHSACFPYIQRLSKASTANGSVARGRRLRRTGGVRGNVKNMKKMTACTKFLSCLGALQLKHRNTCNAFSRNDHYISRLFVELIMWLWLFNLCISGSDIRRHRSSRILLQFLPICLCIRLQSVFCKRAQGIKRQLGVITWRDPTSNVWEGAVEIGANSLWGTVTP